MPVKIRFLIPALLISVGLLYVACGAPPEKSPAKAGASTAEKKAADKAKAVRVKHISGEILAVNTKTKTITVRFKDEDVSLQYEDSTVVKMDLDSVQPSELPLGTRATVKYVERKGRYVARGIFVSTETAEKKEPPPQSSYRNSAAASSGPAGFPA
jgi:hypothetical protein